ncbi:MAG: hypothetical protein IJI14_17415 [Anaerolineaceae bacterium]|nr:hypothetical protein [Anaerolineaceae bacterium]
MGKTPFPLIEKPVGAITYEHTLVTRLYGDIYFGDSERNIFVDKYHEINLCAHYNIRTPGSFSFDSKYYYYVTDGRMCIPLHNSGGIPIEDMVLEKYEGLEAAKKSIYYKDFCDLTANIIKWIDDRKKLGRFPIGGIAGGSGRNEQGKLCIWCEKYLEESDEFVQIYTKKDSNVLEITRSYDTIASLTAHIPEFEELNEKELHIAEHLSLPDIIKEKISPYYEFLGELREMMDLELDANTGTIIRGKPIFGE